MTASDNKKAIMMRIYRWGFGAVLNGIYSGVEYIQKYGKRSQVLPRIRVLYEKIQRHYSHIQPILDENKGDADLRPIRLCSKHITELGKLIEAFEKDHSNDKTPKKIFKTLLAVRDQGEKFRKIAAKYGVYSGMKKLKWNI